jgi:ketosteroid isomerase-like protein
MTGQAKLSKIATLACATTHRAPKWKLPRRTWIHKRQDRAAGIQRLMASRSDIEQAIVELLAMLSPDDAIREKRKLTNRLIAAHQAERLRPHMTEDAVLIVGDGGLVRGADAVVAAFAGQFVDPTFLSYVRTTESVEIAASGRRAAETGRWVGTWKGGVEVGGLYMAAWRESVGQWLLEREMYVTLRG